MRGDQLADHVVGPNAILQTAEALRAEGGEALTRHVFASVGLEHLLDHPPADMVDQRCAAALHGAVCRLLPAPRAEAVAQDSGVRTGAYILAHRIPARAQTVLRLLPAVLAGPILLRAIRQHAWTFAGSGRVSTGSHGGLSLTIADNPLATPGCPWHRAVLEALFSRLVDPDISVSETTCCARGDVACCFVFRRGGAGANAPQARAGL